MQALGLEPDADEREVRRAYARRVKAIDPATDPGGFQTLREHYEAALAWVRARAQADRADAADIEPPGTTTADDGEPDPPEPAALAPSAPPHPVAEPIDPTPPAAPLPVNLWADADGQVFAEFAEAAARAFTDEAAARAALERAQEDPRLVNLEARARFELRVAQLLAQGWRPGHQFLFRAACDAFHWERERSRLFSFGPMGAMLDAAITESLIFYQQPEYQFALQRGLVVRLREDPLPPNDVLARERERLHVLVQRFPHWLHIVTSSANVARWQESLQALAPPPPTPSPVPRASPQPAGAPTAGTRGKLGATDWSGFLLLIGILVVISNMFGRISGPSSNPPYQVPPGTAAALETMRKLTAPDVQRQPSPALNPAWPLLPAAATPVASAPATPRAKPRVDTGRAASHAAQASRPATPGAAPPKPPAWVGQVPGTFDLSASGPLWTPTPLHKAPPNPLKPLRELPTLSETDPANAPWRNGISYELVPRNSQSPASAPLPGP